MGSTDLRGRRVVVTGAGSGIGAALARRLAAGGARVVVNDVDAARAAAVASDAGGLAVPGDAAGEEGVRHLISTAREHLGEIDLFCANAGVGAGRGLESADADWELAWQVNVLGHVRAARLLVPAWLERGHGHFLATVSAAGLLTMLGAAPYSVTKHGALAFAEWLSITYGDRGVRVQALCPQGVRTPMLDAAGPLGAAVLGATAVTAEEVAERVVEALDDGPFLVLPHPEVARYSARRAADPDRWQASMRRMLAQLE